VVKLAISSVVLALAGAAAQQLPTPKNYAETCRLVASWCRPEPIRGRIPQALRRPLHLPKLTSDGRCPTSSGLKIVNDQFGGMALGPGPVRPLVLSYGDLAHGVVRFGGPSHGWWKAKTLWFSDPSYQGPVFIRGRQLGGANKTVFGEAPSLIDPQLAPRPTLNGTNGWREWPGATYLHTLGCYAWQVDGTTFSHVIVFKALQQPS